MPEDRSLKWFIDFDGTISPNKFGESLDTPPFPGCVEVLERARRSGIKVVIFTARVWSGWPYKERRERGQEAMEYLDKHGIEYEAMSADKSPEAEIFVDDRAVRCAAESDPKWWEKFGRMYLQEGKK